MKVLFLDDNPVRKRMFKSSVPFATCCALSSTCITLLESEDWDYLFLDHDLGGQTFVDSSREDTGMEVVRWLAQREPRKPLKRIIVHSFNVPAANRMVATLKNLGYDVRYVKFNFQMEKEIDG